MNKRGHVLNAVLLGLGLGIILGVDPAAPLSATSAERSATRVAELFVPVVLGALFPDVDTAFGKHRKTLHNALVLGVLFGYVFVFDNLQFVWIGVLTHYVLDVVGSKRGIAFFYPLSDEEFGFPTGVATSSRWAGPVTVLVTGVELLALGLVHFYALRLDAGVGGAVQALGV